LTETLLTLAALWLVAIVTPGPNMLFFSAVALSSSARALWAAGAGIMLGTALWGLAGLLGLFWLLEALPGLALAVKLVGGAYIAFIGLRLLLASLRRGGPADEPRSAAPVSPGKAFAVGLATNLSNPKSLLFVTSLFAVTRLAEAPLAVGLAGVALMTAMSTVAYLLFGFALRRLPRRERPGLLARATGALIGALMMAFGARIAFER
jgi:threonine/homoserine/homoserine lactone efflux protein